METIGDRGEGNLQAEQILMRCNGEKYPTARSGVETRHRSLFPYRENVVVIDLITAGSIIFSPMSRKWIQRGNLETLQPSDATVGYARSHRKDRETGNRRSVEILPYWRAGRNNYIPGMKS